MKAISAGALLQRLSFELPLIKQGRATCTLLTAVARAVASGIGVANPYVYSCQLMVVETGLV